MIPRVPEIEGILEEDTGMALQRAKTRVLLGKLRTADDDVFELAERFGIRRRRRRQRRRRRRQSRQWRVAWPAAAE